MNKFRDLTLILGLSIIYILVFGVRSPYVTSQPLRMKTIYDSSNDTVVSQSRSNEPGISVIGEQTGTEKMPAGAYQLPIFNVYTELHTPDKFTAQVVSSKSQADYILVTEKSLHQQFVFVPDKKSTREPKKEVITSPVQVTKPVPDTRGNHLKRAVLDELNENTLRQYIKNSTKTYFYPSLKTGKDVILRIVSSTPYDGKSIVKFTVNNTQSTYFFIGSISVEEDGSTVPVETFADQFISPDSNIEGYIVLRKLKRGIFKVTESGGKQRCLEISFTIP